MPISTYPVTERVYHSGVKHYFISTGKADIFKAVDYLHVADYNNKKVYNLAFGDYNPIDDSINDSIDSDNGDVYHVFYTVLGSIQRFFTITPNSTLMVAGSDSTQEFWEKCKVTCSKNCADVSSCRNKHRRISVYRKYVNKNFQLLSDEYIFSGGIINSDGSVSIEDYILDKPYNVVFVSKK
jgi:hypothetical protein